MYLNFMGDVHGVKNVAKHMPVNCVQVGDLSLRSYEEQFDGLFEDGPRFFVEGNHEHFPSLDMGAKRIYEVMPNLRHIPRGYVSGNVLFMGGADTPFWDWRRRTRHPDWHPIERITDEQVDPLIGGDARIDVVVSHDCPDFLVDTLLDMQQIPMQQRARYPSNDQLGRIFERFRPKLWVFGHHHTFLSEAHDDCWFLCLPPGQMAVIDVPVDPSDFAKV